MRIEEITNFKEEVIQIVRDWFKGSAFTQRKVTDTPTDDLEVVNKKYCDGRPKFAHGVFTKNMADASTEQTIAHGLSKAPKFVRMTAMYILSDGTNSHHATAIGTYDGTTTQQVFMTPGIDGATSTTEILRFIPSSSNIQAATITVDATNITLDWTKTSSPTGSAYVLWEAIN